MLERTGGKKVEPGPYITLESLSCEWEQRNGAIAGLKERIFGGGRRIV